VLIPASVVLQRLHDEVPAGCFTLSWLTDRLHRRSFGIVMLLLALVAIAPGVAMVEGLLAAVIVLAIASSAVWQTVLGAQWLGGLF
jgi:hypothetical protein